MNDWTVYCLPLVVKTKVVWFRLKLPYSLKLACRINLQIICPCRNRAYLVVSVSVRLSARLSVLSKGQQLGTIPFQELYSNMSVPSTGQKSDNHKVGIDYIENVLLLAANSVCNKNAFAPTFKLPCIGADVLGPCETE